MLSPKTSLIWLAVAVAAFHLAYGYSTLGLLILVYLLALFRLAQARTGRQAFYLGLAAGLFTVAPQMSCFWAIFGTGAAALWLVLAIWIGLFVALARLSRLHFGAIGGALLVPFLWTGLEYFRSELYYLRFSWLNIGYAFSGSSFQSLLKWFGVYGIGFLAAAAVSGVSLLKPKRAVLAVLGTSALAILALFLRAHQGFRKAPSTQEQGIMVACVQLEFPTDADVVAALDKLEGAYPDVQLLVLSEYTFDGPVPEAVRAWCRHQKRYLIVGGKDPAPKSNFYDTAFVIGPSGEIVFRQGKCVPIQFFKDGLPAPEQRLWESPWGRIGLCVCYDLSYARVTDRLVRMGAQAIIVPTMDVVEWGRREHELHARIAPVRAAEYGIPIFRVASSGISQLTDSTGRVMAEASSPGQGAMLGGRIPMSSRGSLPLDRWLAPVSVGMTALAILSFMFSRLFAKS